MTDGGKTGHITVVGSICQDLVVTLPHLPARGETVLSHGFETFVGGKGFNQALQAQRLGGQVEFFGKVGRDSFGDDVIRQLKEEGFPDAGISHTGSKTALGMIMVEPDGMNYIAGYSGANMEFMPDDIDRLALLDALANSSYLIIQMEVPEETNRLAMELAKDSGCRVVVNFAPYRATLPADVEMMDLLVFNEVEASGFFGVEIQNVANALHLGCARSDLLGKAVITLGEDGVVVFTDDRGVHIPGKKVDAVDSTGAGDSFVGALVYYLSVGDDLVGAASKANRAAAISVTRMGAMPSLPRAGELL